MRSFSLHSIFELNPIYPNYDLSVNTECKNTEANIMRFSTSLLLRLLSLSSSCKPNSSKAKSRVCLIWLPNPLSFSNENFNELYNTDTGNPSNASVTIIIFWDIFSFDLANSLISLSRRDKYLVYRWQLSIYNHLFRLDLTNSMIDECILALLGSYTSPSDILSSSIFSFSVSFSFSSFR